MEQQVQAVAAQLGRRDLLVPHPPEPPHLLAAVGGRAGHSPAGRAAAPLHARRHARRHRGPSRPPAALRGVAGPPRGLSGLGPRRPRRHPALRDRLRRALHQPHGRLLPHPGPVQPQVLRALPQRRHHRVVRRARTGLVHRRQRDGVHDRQELRGRWPDRPLRPPHPLRPLRRLGRARRAGRHDPPAAQLRHPLRPFLRSHRPRGLHPTRRALGPRAGQGGHRRSRQHPVAGPGLRSGGGLVERTAPGPRRGPQDPARSAVSSSPLRARTTRPTSGRTGTASCGTTRRCRSAAR